MISIYKDFDNPPKDLLGDNPKITTAVKQALYDLYHGKCAYTEEKLGFEEMEVAQYRPKSLYPALELEWSNLLPVSRKIQTLLSEKNFPIGGKKVDSELLLTPQNRRADSACLLAEYPALLHPEVDTPENHLYFNESGYLMAMFEKGTITINLLNLNNNILLEKRQKLYQELKELSLGLNKQLETEEKNILPKLPKDVIQFFRKNNDKKENFSLLRKEVLYHIDRDLKSTAKSVYSEKFNQLFDSVFYTSNFVFAENQVLLQEDIGNNYSDKLPITIKGFEISKIPPIKNISISNIPINTKWIFLTGENGFGKTLILQAIVQVISGYSIYESALRAKIKLELHRAPIGNMYVNFPIKPLSPIIKTWCAYGANRTTISGNINANTQAPQKVNKTDSLFKDIGVLSNVEAYLINIEGKENFEEKGDFIKKLLIELLPSIEEITIDNSKERSVVLYREKAEDGTLMPPITFNALSAGNKSIIAMIGDMVLDLSDSQNVNNPSDLEGIVLIDEIDIHLHPNWQKKFVQTLTKLFPKIQFIASTHSPIPLLGAPKETVILNVEKPSSREGIKVRKLDIDVTTLTPNTILTSPIFGFEGIISDAHDENEPLYTGDTYNDVLFEKHLDKKLEDFAKNSEINLDDLLNPKSND